MSVFSPNDASLKDVCYMTSWCNLHTQTATLNVKLTFAVVWIEMPDFRVVTEMSKTLISQTAGLCFEFIKNPYFAFKIVSLYFII